MSQTDVSYSCGSCGYSLNLASSTHIEPSKSSTKKDFIHFATADLSRFTQLDEVNCFHVSFRRTGLKTKLLCRKCGVFVGYGYGQAPILCGLDSSSNSSNSVYRKFKMNIRALRPSEES